MPSRPALHSPSGTGTGIRGARNAPGAVHRFPPGPVASPYHVWGGRPPSPRRAEYYLFTKCGHAAEDGRADWRPRSLAESIERSLRRLRTDYVDLIQLHSCSERELRKGDVIEALERARERGQARYIGYSGDGAAARYAVECGRFDTLQTSISIADQAALDHALPL